MADPFSKGGPCGGAAEDFTADLTADSLGHGGVTTKTVHSVSQSTDADTDNSSKEKPVAGSNKIAGSEDNRRFNDSSDDEPVGLCDSSSDDIENFMDWRKGG